jgi:hypothetical protein
MQYLIVILFILITGTVKAQTYAIEYNTLYEGTRYQNLLYANDSLSYWEGISAPDATDPAAELLIKYRQSQKVQYIDYVFQKTFYVEDSLHPMLWMPGNEAKTILDYPCFSAYTLFRGRKYVAFYTNTLPSFIGPWKFGGLPGAILEVTSTDQSYQFKATSLSVNTENDMESSFEDKAIISWDEYCRQFIKTTDYYVRYMQTADAGQGSLAHIKIDRPEIIYPKAQSGIGVGTE